MGLKLIYFTFISFIALPNFAQKTDTTYRAGYVYSDSIVYMLNAPKGWVFDNKSGLPQYLPAVFYPKTSSFATAATIMYSNYTMVGKQSMYKSLQKVIQKDSLQHKENAPATVITKLPQQIISKRQKTVATLINYKNAGNLTTEEITAYILYNNRVVIITMSAPNNAAYETNKFEFFSLVKSFVYISDYPKKSYGRR